jgi:purine-nucleoside phosphorylase
MQVLDQTLSYLRSAGISRPEIGIILGTGLSRLADEISREVCVNYGDIPHFPVSTVESHRGQLIYGTMHGRRVMAMQGRFHYYEGYSLGQVTYPVRVMKALGVKCLLISNAAGALNPSFRKGSLMLIDDHINFLPDNPLRGKNNDAWGPRFPDMSMPYSVELNRRMLAIARRENIVLHKGVYVAVPGPNLETRAEYRMFRNFADAVGMSTVPEVIVANHVSLPCAAVSVLTDECDPDNLTPASIVDILKTAAEAELLLCRIFSELIAELPDPISDL